MHICHPGTQAPEAGGSQVQGQPCYVVSLSRLEEKKRWRGGGSHCCSLRRASCSESGVFFFFSFFILLVKTPYGYLSQYLAHRVSFCCGVGEHLIFFFKVYFDFCCFWSSEWCTLPLWWKDHPVTWCGNSKLYLRSESPHTHRAYKNANRLVKVKSGVLLWIFWVLFCLADFLK